MTETRVGHVKTDDIDVYCARGDGGDAHLNNTPIHERGWLGNPYTCEEYGRFVAIEKYAQDFRERLVTDDAFRDAVAGLAGAVLGCWCQGLHEDGPACHAEVVATWADKLAAVESNTSVEVHHRTNVEYEDVPYL